MRRSKTQKEVIANEAGVKEKNIEKDKKVKDVPAAMEQEELTTTAAAAA